MEKLNLTQQKHTFTNQTRCATTQNKCKKLKPGLVASYYIRPENGEGLFWFWCFINSNASSFDSLAVNEETTRLVSHGFLHLFDAVGWETRIITTGQRIQTRGDFSRAIFHWANLMSHLTASMAGQSECWLTVCREIPMSGPLGTPIWGLFVNRLRLDIPTCAQNLTILALAIPAI